MCPPPTPPSTKRFQTRFQRKANRGKLDLGRVPFDMPLGRNKTSLFPPKTSNQRVPENFIGKNTSVHTYQGSTPPRPPPRTLPTHLSTENSTRLDLSGLTENLKTCCVCRTNKPHPRPKTRACADATKKKQQKTTSPVLKGVSQPASCFLSPFVEKAGERWS